MRITNYTPSITSRAGDFQPLLYKIGELMEEKRALMENTEGAVLFASCDTSRIYDANTFAEDLTGYPKSRLIGMSLHELFSSASDSDLKLNTDEFTGLTVKKHNILLQRSDGRTIPVAPSSCLLNAGSDTKMLITLDELNHDRQDDPASVQDIFVTGEKGLSTIDDFPNIIGKSDNIREICALIGKVAKTDSTVLLQGESGTGKEIIAQAIHYHSHRANGPFIRVNCAALSETLLESELFGHVKGAFTGAIRDRKGRFSKAEGGTIMLDEIGSMSISGQTKLLRVLQEREFEPVGSSTTVKANVRVIATTNVNLKQAVNDNLFREDLYYRLSVITICVSPLRDRKEDIPLLANFFLKKANETAHKKITGFSPASIDLLMNHQWPGNVRELENVVEHAVVVEETETVRPSSMPLPHDQIHASCDEACKTDLGLKERLAIMEKHIVLQTLEKENWVRKRAARVLGIDPRNFNYFMKKHNISV